MHEGHKAYPIMWPARIWPRRVTRTWQQLTRTPQSVEPPKRLPPPPCATSMKAQCGQFRDCAHCVLHLARHQKAWPTEGVTHNLYSCAAMVRAGAVTAMVTSALQPPRERHHLTTTSEGQVKSGFESERHARMYVERVAMQAASRPMQGSHGALTHMLDAWNRRRSPMTQRKDTSRTSSLDPLLTVATSTRACDTAECASTSHFFVYEYVAV
jgi:hypothetical protein